MHDIGGARKIQRGSPPRIRRGGGLPPLKPRPEVIKKPSWAPFKTPWAPRIKLSLERFPETLKKVELSVAFTFFLIGVLFGWAFLSSFLYRMLELPVFSHHRAFSKNAFSGLRTVYQEPDGLWRLEEIRPARRRVWARMLATWPKPELDKLRQIYKASLLGTVENTLVPLPNPEQWSDEAGGLPKFFAQSGHFRQMWVREACAALHPLVVIPGVLDSGDGFVRRAVEGVVRYMAERMIEDPSCGILETPNRKKKCRNGPPHKDVFSEPDSVAWFLRLLRTLRDEAIADEDLVHRAMAAGVMWLLNQIDEQTGLVRAGSR